MRYFYYTNTNSGQSTVIIIDENSPYIRLYPAEGRVNYAQSKSDWLSHYKNLDAKARQNMYEICENQFKKFKEHGTVPDNWDW